MLRKQFFGNTGNFDAKLVPVRFMCIRESKRKFFMSVKVVGCETDWNTGFLKASGPNFRMVVLVALAASRRRVLCPTV